MYSIKEILLLVAVQHNNSRVKKLAQLLTEEECQSRQLSKENQKAFGLKKPKLSKALIELKLPEKVVSLALSTPTADTLPRVSAELEDLLEQGDSAHYESCQRTGGELNEIADEVQYLGSYLWLYVIGERKSLSGEGFKARCKIRLLTKEDGLTPAGFYLERPYGQFSALLSHINVLREWVDHWCSEKGLEPLPLFMPPVWQRDNGGGNDFQSAYGSTYHTPLYCPSAEGGYQDTMTHGTGPYNFFEEVGVTTKNLVRMSYEKRPTMGGVYTCSLKEHVWNPQKSCFQHPPLAKEWRGLIDSYQKSLIEIWIAIFGYPQERFGRGIEVSSVVEDIKVSVRQLGDEYSFIQENVTLGIHNKFLRVIQRKLEVIQDSPLGFWKPVSLFEKWIRKEGEEITTDEIALAEFWVDSFGYPAEGEFFTCVRHRLKITHRGYNFVVLLNNGEKCIILESDGVRREEYLYTHSLYQDTREVWCTEPELGFWQATPLQLRKATLECSNLLGFGPVEVGEDFSYGEYLFSIFLNSARQYSLIVNVPADRFPKTLLEVKEDSLKVKYNLPELGFLKARTLEEEFFGKTFYTEARTVQRDCPELGFLKAVPIINYQVNDHLWVTGPLPNK